MAASRGQGRQPPPPSKAERLTGSSANRLQEAVSQNISSAGSATQHRKGTGTGGKGVPVRRSSKAERLTGSSANELQEAVSQNISSAGSATQHRKGTCTGKGVPIRRSSKAERLTGSSANELQEAFSQNISSAGSATQHGKSTGTGMSTMGKHLSDLTRDLFKLKTQMGVGNVHPASQSRSASEPIVTASGIVSTVASGIRNIQQQSAMGGGSKADQKNLSVSDPTGVNYVAHQRSDAMRLSMKSHRSDRSLSRRVRSNAGVAQCGRPAFPGKAANPSYLQLMEANFCKSLPNPALGVEHSIASALVGGLANDHLCDVVLEGSDGMRVPAVRFLLAIHSPVFDKVLFPRKGGCGGDADEQKIADVLPSACESVVGGVEVVAGKNILRTQMTSHPPPNISAAKSQQEQDDADAVLAHSANLKCPVDNDDGKTLRVNFCSGSVIRAALYYMASRSLSHPDAPKSSNNFEKDETEFNTRAVSQLLLFGRTYKIKCIEDHAYRTARRLINKKNILACAAFDELVKAEEMKAKDDDGDNEGMPHKSSTLRKPISMTMLGADNDLKEYALQILRDNPHETLVGGTGGLVMLTSSRSIETIVKDQQIDVDEKAMFSILNGWVKSAPGDENEKMEVGKFLVSNINLSFIDPQYLKGAVKHCGFVDEEDVKDALELIEWIIENQDPKDKEHIMVAHAGDEDINGMYMRVEEEIGMDSHDLIFVKEATGEDGKFTDFGLYRWNTSWYIGPCADYSTVRYSFKRPESTCITLNNSKTVSIPKWGWKSVTGKDPAPLCEWKPSRDETTCQDETSGLAPTLEKMMDPKSQKAGGDYADRKMLTLDDMMNLPVDEEFDDVDEETYRSHNRTLSSMLDLPEDEGFADSESGYDLNNPLIYVPEEKITNAKL